MLRLQRQGHWECFPTSIAMLCNVDKGEVLNQWQAMTGTPFNAENTPGLVFWPLAYRLLASRFGPDVAKAYEQVVNAGNARIRAYRKDTWSGSIGAGEATVPATGRGLLQLININDFGITRHSVAYCDGLIYNPDGDTPCTWEEYQKAHPGWVLEGVIETAP